MIDKKRNKVKSRRQDQGKQGSFRYAVSLDLPIVSVTMNSHLKKLPMLSNHSLYGQEHYDCNGLKDLFSSEQMYLSFLFFNTV